MCANCAWLSGAPMRSLTSRPILFTTSWNSSARRSVIETWLAHWKRRLFCPSKNTGTTVARPCCTRRPTKGFQSGSAETEEHTSELQSLMRISYAVFCLKKKKNTIANTIYKHTYYYRTKRQNTSLYVVRANKLEQANHT